MYLSVRTFRVGDNRYNKLKENKNNKNKQTNKVNPEKKNENFILKVKYEIIYVYHLRQNSFFTHKSDFVGFSRKIIVEDLNLLKFCELVILLVWISQESRFLIKFLH